MPASDLFDPEDRTATGTKVKYLYCPDYGGYSGGRICRQCQRGYGVFVPPFPRETVPQGRCYYPGNPLLAATWSRALVDVSFHLDGRTYDYEQPIPRRLQAAFRHCVNAAAELSDLDRVQVTLQSGATPCSFTIAATPALLSITVALTFDRIGP